jgi:hypothetical protein
VDGSGNTYITGSFKGTATFGSTTLTALGLEDVFIAKTDSSGNFLWAKSAGGTASDIGTSIAVDNSGNSYITGKFNGLASFGEAGLVSSQADTQGAPSDDVFVAKLSSSGTFLWVRKAGGMQVDQGNSIAVDASGNAYLTGAIGFGTASFGSTSLTHESLVEVFIAKVDASGNFLWARRAGGSDVDISYSITVDASGNAYTTGVFKNTATFGAISLTSAGFFDIFVLKMDPNGNFVWARRAGSGGFNDEGANSVAVDASGNSYIAGYFEGTATFGSTTLTGSGSLDVFVAKLDANGSFVWAKAIGGASSDSGNSIAVDGSGNAYIAGAFQGTVTFGASTLTSAGGSDVFTAKMDTNGNFLWARRAGGTFSLDTSSSIAVDASGNSYITGGFGSTATFDSTSLTSAGDQDIFIQKIPAGP